MINNVGYNRTSGYFVAKIKFSTGQIIGYDDETMPGSPVNDNKILSLNINQSICNDDYVLGSTNSSSVDVEIHEVSSFTIKGKQFTLYIGFINNGSITWCSKGVYFADKPTVSGNTTKFTAYDKMNLLTNTYEPTNFSGNKSPYQIISNICACANIQLASSSSLTNLQNETWDSIAVENLVGYTYKDAIGYVASYIGRNAMFNGEGKLDLIKFTNQSVKITDNNTIDPVVDEENHTITCLYVNNGNAQIVSPSNGSGTTGISIENPIIITQSQADNLLSYLQTMLATYRVASINYLMSFPGLEVGDVIQYENMEGNTFSIPIMSIESTFDGGFSSVINSFGKTQEELQDNSESASIVARKFAAFQSKTSSSIEKMAEKATEYITANKNGSVYYEKDANGGCSAIYIIPNKGVAGVDYTSPYNAGVTDWMLLSGAGMAFTMNGGSTYSYCFNGNGMLIAQALACSTGTVGGWSITENGLEKTWTYNNIPYKTMFNSDLANSDVLLSLGPYPERSEYLFAVGKDGGLCCQGLTGNGNATISGDIQFNKARIHNQILGYNQKTSSWTGLVGMSESSGNCVIGSTEQSGNTNVYCNASGNINLTGSTVVGSNKSFEAKGSVYFTALKTSGTTVSTLNIDSSGHVWKTSSSKRYKENITSNIDDINDPKRLYDLELKQFNYKKQYENMQPAVGSQIGIIAEELAEIYPKGAIYNDDGTIESWQERILIPAMLKLIQEQNERISKLEKTIYGGDANEDS